MTDAPLALEQLNSSTVEKTTKAGQQFLRFHLLPDTTALLPVNQLTEVITIPLNQIVPIPHLPPFVMGVYNWRGEILWIVDLGHLIGFAPLYQQTANPSSYTVIVIHENHTPSGKQPLSRQGRNQKTLGLVVHHVEDMEWCNPDLIQSPPTSAVSSKLVPFLRGHWLSSEGEIQIVLQGKSILAGMPNITGN